MKKITFLLVSMLIYFSINLFSQTNSTPDQRHSPTVENEVGASSNSTINHFNGKLNVGVPLGSIEFYEFNIPVNLIYDGSGVLVNQESGWLGSNWNLDIGCSITRTIRGNDDIQSRVGTCSENSRIYSNSNREFFQNIKSLFGEQNESIEVTDPIYTNAFEHILEFEGAVDLEYDIFSYSIPGYNGKFIINELGEIIEQEPSPVLIEFIPSDQNINEHFKITDPFGFSYYFQGNEHSTTTKYHDRINSAFISDPELISHDQDLIVFSNDECSPYTLYSPYKITSAQSTRVIYFSFSGHYSSSQLITEYKKVISVNNASTVDCNCEDNHVGELKVKRFLSTVYGKRLSSISTSTGVNLLNTLTSSLSDYNAMNDQPNDDFHPFPESKSLPQNNDLRLNGLRIYNFKKGYWTNFNFEYTIDVYSSYMKSQTGEIEDLDDQFYYNPAQVRKYFLSKLVKKIHEGIDQVYQFSYNQGKMAKFGSLTIDGFGYSKDVNSGYSSYNYQNEIMELSDRQISSSDLNSMKVGTLYNVINPDGSGVLFDYELHSYAMEINGVPISPLIDDPSPGLRIASVIYYNDANRQAYNSASNTGIIQHQPSFNRGLKKIFKYSPGILLSGIGPVILNKFVSAKGSFCQCETTERIHTFNSSSKSEEFGYSVGYDQVTEEWYEVDHLGNIVQPKGKLTYVYSRFIDRVNRLSGSYSGPSTPSISFPIYLFSLDTYSGLFAPNTSYAYKNGLLLEKSTYKSLSNLSYELEEKIEYQYEYINESDNFSLKFYKVPANNSNAASQYFITRYSWRSGTAKLINEVISSFKSDIVSIKRIITNYSEGSVFTNTIDGNSVVHKSFQVPSFRIFINPGEKTRFEQNIYSKNIKLQCEANSACLSNNLFSPECGNNFEYFLGLNNGLKYTVLGNISGYFENYNEQDFSESLSNAMVTASEFSVPSVFNFQDKCYFKTSKIYDQKSNSRIPYNNFQYFQLYNNSPAPNYFYLTSQVFSNLFSPPFQEKSFNIYSSFLYEKITSSLQFKINNAKIDDFAYTSFEENLDQSILYHNLNFHKPSVTRYFNLDQTNSFEKSITGYSSYLLSKSHPIYWELVYVSDNQRMVPQELLPDPPNYVPYNNLNHLVTFWTCNPEFIKIYTKQDNGPEIERSFKKGNSRNGFVLVYLFIDNIDFSSNFQLKITTNTPENSTKVDELRIYPINANCETTIENMGLIGFSSYMDNNDEAYYKELFYDSEGFINAILRDSKSNIRSIQIYKNETYEN